MSIQKTLMCLLNLIKPDNIWAIIIVEYITWKIVPRFDYPCKKRIFITVQICEFGLYLIYGLPVVCILDLVLVFLHISK